MSKDKKIKKLSFKEFRDLLKMVLNKKIIKHSERVYGICEEIINECHFEVDEELLYQSACLHDIGKLKDSSEPHSLFSVILFRRHMKCNKTDANKIQSVILSHNSVFNPLPEVAKEAAILRMADKIDKFRKKDKFQKAQKHFQESIQEIEKYFLRMRMKEEFYQISKACELIKEQKLKELE